MAITMFRSLAQILLLLWISCRTFALDINNLDTDWPPPGSSGSKRLTYRKTTPYPSAELYPKSYEFDWVAGPNISDGWFTVQTPRGLGIQNILSGQITHFGNSTVNDPAPKNADGWSFNADQTKAVYLLNKTPGFRYSFKADYFLQDLVSKKVEPLVEYQRADVQLVVWNPKNPKQLAYVWRNNIFLWDDGKTIPLTTDGNANIFNGVPDWVYEEEILESRTAMWWSPDGEALAWLRTDDTEVYNYSVNYYLDEKTPGKRPPPTYPRELKLKYPKVGYPNPKAEVRLLRMKSQEFPRLWQVASCGTREIVGEVAWISESDEKLLVRCFNRLQNDESYSIHHTGGAHGQQMTYFDRLRKVQDGWLENTKSVHYVGNVTGLDSYIDINDQDGWMHIWVWPTKTEYKYNPAIGNVEAITLGKQLTKGKWDVRKIHGVDMKKGLVYFTSSENHPTESHPFSLNLVTGEKKPLVELKPGYWDMSISPGAEYAVLHREGPGIPHQTLFVLNGTAQPVQVLEDNENLANTLREYALPKTQIMDLVHPNGYNLSAKLVTPPSFDDSGAKKYPVLLTPYGGPGSQEVTKRFPKPSFKEYLSSDPDLEYVTFTVDNRGTGFRGSKFRNAYYKNMGTVDVQDQMWAARWLAKTYPWVDRDRIGMWGWSNGGYLSAKCVESGDDILAFAISTAPTSDQRLYDSVYSERYFGSLPDDDPATWDRSAITNATGFKSLRGSILFQHGTGDDNVHFQHSLVMVDMLMQAGVHPDKVQVQYFPDSEHSIRYGRDPEFLYKQITAKLFMEKSRVHDRRRTKIHEWEQEAGDPATREKYFFEENRRNVLLSEEMRPGTRSKWKMDQGDEVIGGS